MSVAAQTLVPSIYLALITCAGCWVGGLLIYPSLASGELRATLSRTLAEIGMAVSGCAHSFERGSRAHPSRSACYVPSEDL